jgi:hypothetical protein
VNPSDCWLPDEKYLVENVTDTFVWAEAVNPMIASSDAMSLNIDLRLCIDFKGWKLGPKI